MSTKSKKRIAMFWASSCGGCDISLLEIGGRILDVAEAADIVFWPCAMDFKYRDVESLPDGSIDVCLFNGGVRNSEQHGIARLLRRKSRLLVAYGACAADGGIPALANLTSREAIFEAAYHGNQSTENPEGAEPQPRWRAPAGELHLPEFYETVFRLSDVVQVDFELPGCPPQAERVWETLQVLLGAPAPDSWAGGRVGCSPRTVCDECPLEKKMVKVSAFRRHHEFRPEPGHCLLEQGILCMGPATRGGCGALCVQAGMRCEGCYGPPAGVPDQGAAMIGALSGIVDAANEERAGELVNQVADPTGTFYRFTLPAGFLKTRRHMGGDS
jgi:F420-non-reducing hydrogenase small subunit